MSSRLAAARTILIKAGLVFGTVAPILPLTFWPSVIVSGDGKLQKSTSGIKLPSGYRDWKLISVAHEAGKLNDLRAVLGNDEALQAYRSKTLPFPDGAIIVRLAWTSTPSEENNKVFGQNQSFVAGAPTNVQLMLKDSKRFISRGGWGFAQFTGGQTETDEATDSCFSCHTPVKDRDYVFTHYAP